MDGSDTSRLRDLKDLLTRQLGDLVGTVKLSPAPDVDFAVLIPKDRVGPRIRRGKTSLRQLHSLESVIREELGVAVRWVFLPADEAPTIETALMEILNARFPGAVESVLVSTPDRPPVWVWIELHGDQDGQPSMNSLEKVAADLFGLFGLEPPSVAVTNAAELPTVPNVLRMLKTRAPVDVAQMAEWLSQSSPLIVDVRWLQARFDALRKMGYVVRSKEGAYSLTERGLAIVPHGKRRTSSDIDRVLALARRKW